MEYENSLLLVWEIVVCVCVCVRVRIAIKKDAFSTTVTVNSVTSENVGENMSAKCLGKKKEKKMERNKEDREIKKFTCRDSGGGGVVVWRARYLLMIFFFISFRFVSVYNAQATNQDAVR